MTTINAFDLEELKEKLKENNINHLSKVKNAAVKTMTNFGGITILVNSTSETIFYQYYDNEIKETEIKYYFKDQLGDDFDHLDSQESYTGFEIEGYEKPFLLNEFLRVDYYG